MGGRHKKKKERKRYMLMAEGAAEAIKDLTTLTAYFPTVLLVRAGVSGMRKLS